MRETWLTIVNPHAGNGRTLSKWKYAKNLFKKLGLLCEVRYTSARYHAIKIASQAASAGFRKFLVVGGDGTVHETLNGIMKSIESLGGGRTNLSDFTLAVLPIGSGNDWVRSHNLSRNTDEIVDLIYKNSFVKQDIVKVKTSSRLSYLMNIGGMGFDAGVCARVERSKTDGRGGKSVYFRSVLMTLLRYKTCPVKLVCDGKTVFEDQFLSMSFGNGRFSGGGMLQTPNAVYDDGLIDVTVISKIPLLRVLANVVNLFTGKILDIKGVFSFRAKKVELLPVAGERKEMVEADGEVIGEIPATLEVYSEQINVLHKD